MRKVIGRFDEQKILEKILKSKKAEFIAVYGRRRVGKTFLVKTFADLQDAIFFHVTGIKDGLMRNQIYEFTRAIETTFYHNEIELKEPEDWKSAFELLTRTIKSYGSGKKHILFFDELPWLATQKSGFLQALDYYWNRFWSDIPTLKLIVCGSAASWMLENIIHHKGGLHNRITARILLDPFNLHESKEYLKANGFSYTDPQILDLYLAIGGVPYYLQLLDKKLSVPQNIDHLCFNKKGALLEEFNVLYASLFSEAEAHEEIVRVLAQKRRGIERKELLKKLKLSVDGGTFNKRLAELQAAGFIASFKPYGFKKRGTYLRIIDEYTLFYFSWIEPALTTIKKITRPNRYWLEKSQSPHWRSWAGYAFEAVCYKHIEQIRKALRINPSAEIGSWQYIPKKGEKEDGAEIDLLFDRNDGVITICEIKCSNHPFKITKPEAQDLLKKIEVFKKQTGATKQITVAFITLSGLQQTMYAEELVVGVVTLEDLLKE